MKNKPPVITSEHDKWIEDRLKKAEEGQSTLDEQSDGGVMTKIGSSGRASEEIDPRKKFIFKPGPKITKEKKVKKKKEE